MDNVGKQITLSKDTTECTEECTFHKDEIIKFYCDSHKFLGCNDCKTLNHITCKIDYISDKCANIGDSDEYRDTLKEIDQKIKGIEAIIDQAKLQDNEVDMSYNSLFQDIVNFRKELNDHLDIIQKKFEKKAEEQKYKCKDTIAKVLQTCTSLSSDMKNIRSNLQYSKTSQKNRKSYILIKQAQSKLKTDDEIAANESLEQTDVPYIFERNKELENVVTEQNTFGTLSFLTTKNTSREKKSIDEVTHKGNIDVRTKSDKTTCFITGCAVLSSSKVVLADWKNSKLKLVDIERKLVTEEKTLESTPWDIARLPHDQIAVTVPEREIFLLKIAEKLSIIRKIRVSKRDCRGITYHKDHLYVVCGNPDSVLVVDTQGSVRNIIHMESKTFKSPNYPLLSEDPEHIYISGFTSDSVVSVTLQGGISAVYRHKDLYKPVGMVMLDDGSLLVGCWNGTLHKISGDLKQGKVIQYGLKHIQSICYNQHKQEFYIGGTSDQLMIMK